MTERFVVAGAPCSGKSTYVQEHARVGDLIYDYDTLHQALSGQASHQHLDTIRPYVLAARDAILADLEAHKEQSAWVITSTPRARDLRALSDRLGADVVLIEVDRDEAHRRCDAAGRPTQWHGYIDHWFDESDIDAGEWNPPDERGDGERGDDMSAIGPQQRDMERRTVTGHELRLVVSEDGEPARIVGHAAVFNQWSQDLGGFRERIAPGAFTRTLGEADVRALWNHDPNYVLGRNRAETLALREDDEGLAFEVLPPETVWANDLLVSMRRGDVDQMSFGFRTVRDNWLQDSDGNISRELLEVELFDVSVVTFPAYPQTSAQVRVRVEELTAVSQVDAAEADRAAAARARLAIMRRELELEEVSV